MGRKKTPSATQLGQDKEIDPIDITVGKNIRRRRKELRYAQPDLAKVISVSYQQMQKYESGFNRICAGKLFRLSIYLQIPVAAFFKPIETDNRPTVDSADEIDLTDPAIQELSYYFNRIEDPRLQEYLIDLVDLLGPRDRY